MLQSPWSMHVMSSAPQASLAGGSVGLSAVPHTSGGVRGRLGDARSEQAGRDDVENFTHGRSFGSGAGTPT